MLATILASVLVQTERTSNWAKHVRHCSCLNAADQLGSLKLLLLFIADQSTASQITNVDYFCDLRCQRQWLV